MAEEIDDVHSMYLLFCFFRN